MLLDHSVIRVGHLLLVLVVLVGRDGCCLFLWEVYLVVLTGLCLSNLASAFPLLGFFC